MNLLTRLAFAVLGLLAFAAPALADDPGRIDAYVSPYYNSRGPVVHVAPYSLGLASSNQQQFVATIARMQKNWRSLNFVELYVAAIRLYDLGYRNDATYWFYTAQYAGRLFALTADPKKLGGMGSPGFELIQAQNAFFQLAGPDINGWAFGNVDGVIAVIRRVQKENQRVPNLHAIYPGVAFIEAKEWKTKNYGLNAGLGQLAEQLKSQKNAIAQQRAQNGAASRFAHLTSKQLPGS